ncbi:conserved hypothetical protein [Flavobacterium sp. 9R]|uniref:hypothetical protein n=1 Tax=Flavobacterium sp. 9R TaxID=2653143 RepID=UPI0012F1E9E8|nr:hypothetical protein [Flavobacterium sp. 9R]VXB65190.1 conserved hypothetical protein [Flavobacterium sp. 9R]
MNKFKIIIVFSILTALMSFKSINEWYQYDSSEFKVLFPKMPNSTIKKINTEAGELQMQVNMYDASKDETDENLIYSVTSSEYPKTHIESHIKHDSLNTFFRNSIEGMVNNVKGKLISESKINLGNFQGREFKIDFRDGLAIIKTRMYLVENKVYFLQTITKTDKEKNKLIEKFMNSFTIKK